VWHLAIPTLPPYQQVLMGAWLWQDAIASYQSPFGCVATAGMP
ncbi:hypothetical protein HMPREF0673_01734, partial [Leyella stercorea DSM 18206]